MIASYFAGRRKSGFTLIELLVVIGIITLLAAILFPAFARARDMGRRASCQSNLRQLGLAVQQYTQDYDERLPNVQDGDLQAEAAPNVSLNYFSFEGGSTRKFDATKSALYPYIKNKQIFICPSDSGGQSQGQTYAVNSCLFSTAAVLIPPYTAFVRSGRALAEFEDTSTRGFFFEEYMQGSTDDGYFNRLLPNEFSTRHLGGSVVGYLDGHVKWLNQNKLLTDFPQTATEGNCN